MTDFALPPELLDLEKRKLELEIAKLERTNSFEAGSSYQRRVVDFVGEVHEAKVHTAIEAITRLANVSPEPIVLRIDSQGGTVTDGLALFDYVRMLRTEGIPVNTQGIGLVASMGVVLLQAGEKRSLSKRCRCLIHEVSTVLGGSMGEIDDWTKETKALQEVLVDILAERSSMTKVGIKRAWRRRDWWLSAEEMVKQGFADEVL